MNRTKIDWVKNPDGTQGYTWNPITGCLNHINGMCKGGNFPCYAYRLAHGRLKERYLANENLAGGYHLARGVLNENSLPPNLDPFYPRFSPDRLYELKRPLATLGHARLQEPKGIFVCDMSDLFGIGIPREWTEQVFYAIKDRPEHRFYLLTKQPQNLPQWSPFPDNCWVGVTATGGVPFLRAVEALLEIEAKTRYISFEPLLEWHSDNWLYSLEHYLKVAGINQVIIGAQTKPYKPPKIEWVREIVEAADKAGVSVFLKDNLKPLLPYRWFTNRPSEDWAYTQIGKLRQELPK